MLHIEFTLSYIELYLIAINTVAFFLYAYDKLQAVKNTKYISRVPENTLLISTLLAGTIGSLFAMLLFRHKIKKTTFIIKFLLVFTLQISLALLYMKGILFNAS